MAEFTSLISSLILLALFQDVPFTNQSSYNACIMVLSYSFFVPSFFLHKRESEDLQ